MNDVWGERDKYDWETVPELTGLTLNISNALPIDIQTTLHKAGPHIVICATVVGSSKGQVYTATRSIDVDSMVCKGGDPLPKILLEVTIDALETYAKENTNP